MTKDGDPDSELAGVTSDNAVLIPLIPNLDMLSSNDGSECIIKREDDEDLEDGRTDDEATQMFSVVNNDGSTSMFLQF